MNYRDILTAGSESLSRSIGLATHLGTDIPNLTTDPTIRQNTLATRKERQFEVFKRLREPIAGYNCFGLVFASRRTAIYWDNDAQDEIDLDQLLAEDGYGEIVSEDRWQVGDVVIYSDDRGPKHAAVITRFDYILHGGDSRVPVVLSKFGDLSGEYEHPMAVTTWDDFRFRSGALIIRVYRNRHEMPKGKPGSLWRGIVTP